MSLPVCYSQKGDRVPMGGTPPIGGGGVLACSANLGHNPKFLQTKLLTKPNLGADLWS
jgi:hypothetical protein